MTHNVHSRLPRHRISERSLKVQSCRQQDLNQCPLTHKARTERATVGSLTLVRLVKLKLLRVTIANDDDDYLILESPARDVDRLNDSFRQRHLRWWRMSRFTSSNEDRIKVLKRGKIIWSLTASMPLSGKSVGGSISTADLLILTS